MVLALALLLAGCGKKPAAGEVQAVQDTNSAATAAVNSQPQPTPTPPSASPALPAPVQPNSQVDMAELNRDLLRWVMRNHRRPANFEDFAATAGVTIPPPPAGKKYIIAQDMHVRLVDK